MHHDWSEQVHYISIRYVPYITQVHCWDTVHVAYIISMNTHNLLYIL